MNAVDDNIRKKIQKICQPALASSLTRVWLAAAYCIIVMMIVGFTIAIVKLNNRIVTLEQKAQVLTFCAERPHLFRSFDECVVTFMKETK